ncbi:hypothetical protein AHAS_Ahas15G0194100 [Arachis hypogaea]
MEEKEAIPEIGFKLKESEYPMIRKVTEKRRWELLCEPLTDISATMIQEFYANAVRQSKTTPPYKSYVRGVEVNFSPAAVMRVLQIRAIPLTEPSFEERTNGENDPDELVNEICMEGKDWVRDLNGDPCHLKRIDLKPEAKDSIQELAEDSSKSTRLGHPSTILHLCNRAWVLF